MIPVGRRMLAGVPPKTKTEAIIDTILGGISGEAFIAAFAMMISIVIIGIFGSNLLGYAAFWFLFLGTSFFWCRFLFQGVLQDLKELQKH